MTNESSSFGSLLRQAREASGTGVTALAEALGVSRQYVHQVEAGRAACLTQEKTIRAAELLRVDAAPLLLARGELSLPTTGDAFRDILAARLAIRWATLDKSTLDAVKRLLDGAPVQTTSKASSQPSESPALPAEAPPEAQEGPTREERAHAHAQGWEEVEGGQWHHPAKGLLLETWAMLAPLLRASSVM